jgi:prepilin-type N-terminal cleavage/methylation domain-containing protein
MKNEGFTLIEVLVAIVIIAVAIISIVAVFPQSLNQATQSEHISMINHLGQAKLDELRGYGWNNNKLIDGTHPSTGLGDAAAIETHDNFSEIPSGFSRTWVVDDIDSGLRKSVKVTVGYLVYDDAGNLLSTSVKAYSPQSINRRTATFTTILTKP